MDVEVVVVVILAVTGLQHFAHADALALALKSLPSHLPTLRWDFLLERGGHGKKKNVLGA